MDKQKKTLAVVLSRFPYPLDKGDKLRAYHQIKFLSEYFDVYLFVFESEENWSIHVNHLKPYCKGIQIYPLHFLSRLFQGFLSLLHKEPFQVGYFFSPSIKKKFVKTITALNPDVVYAQLSRTAKYVKDLPIKKVIDFQDAFSLNYSRIAQQENGIRKWFYTREGNYMKIFEQRMLTWFDAGVIISEKDKSEIGKELVVVGNGVSTDLFVPRSATKKFDLLFVGNLSYLPNEQAVFYLVQKVMPFILQTLPDCKLVIAGAGLSDKIKSLQSKQIEIKGWVEDVVQLYNESKVLIAPLWTGAGLQNKVLEAMSCGIPVVTTPVVNASLGAEPQSQILIADHAYDFAIKTIELLNDPQAQKRLAEAGRQYIEQHFSWEKANQILVNVIEQQLK